MHSAVSKELWEEWASHPVTEAVRLAIKDRIGDSKDEIVNSTNPDFDRFLKGMIWAFNEVLDFKPDFTEESEDVDEVSSGDAGSQGYS